MSKSGIFVVDSDVFITAKDRYYAFDLCPGFWKCVLHSHATGRVNSIDRVKTELLMGSDTDYLVAWVKRSVPDTFFKSVGEQAVVAKYGEIMRWSQRSSQHMDAAKAKFATGADGWLVAYAAVHGQVVVTNEQPAPASKKDIKIPDVCQQFAVPFVDTFQMLRGLGARFDWDEPR